MELIQDNGGAPIILPRTAKTVPQLCEYLPMDGLVIAEGNDLSDDILQAYGCSVPERLSQEAAKKFASDTEMDVSKDWQCLHLGLKHGCAYDFLCRNWCFSEV